MAVTTNLISLRWQNTFCLTNVIMQTQGNILHNDGVRQKLRCFPEKHASLFTTRLKCVWHSFYQNASQVPTLKDGEYMYTNLRPRANSVQTVDTVRLNSTSQEVGRSLKFNPFSAEVSLSEFSTQKQSEALFYCYIYNPLSKPILLQ